ncbi:Pre-mRNA-splicing factor SYF2 [Rhynchospora pubera]|uniref:Pre-mRNA-splicing factor SYF2 n=1 Tax=Rhynchospora pubera TaxID=906938 RepID=A0AAV8H283_9POAL|nr:Pre-mRNA-splicing factor SYF2 [Rhynchospora pubera]
MEECGRKGEKESQWVYRISVGEEWDELQQKGSSLGGDLDRTTRCIHLSDLNQVKMVLTNFFAGREDLYLLQIDAAKLREGLVYESADGTNYFPHFYGPQRSFVPLPSDSVVKADKLVLVDGNFTCSLLD